MPKASGASLSKSLEREEVLRFWGETHAALPFAAVLCDERWKVLASNPGMSSLFPLLSAGDNFIESSRSAVDPFFPSRLEQVLHETEEAMPLTTGGRQTDRALQVRIGLTDYLVNPTRVNWKRRSYRQLTFTPTSPEKTDEPDIKTAFPVSEILGIVQEPIFAWRFHNQVIEYWNEASAQFYGYSLSEACGQQSDKLLCTHATSGFDEIKRRLLLDRRWSGELQHRTRDGTAVVVETHMALLERTGEMFVLQANSDVTMRRQAEQALRFHFELNRSVTSQAVDPIFVIGGKGEIIFSNPEASRVFGWTQKEFLGQQLHQTLHHHTPNSSLFPANECPLLRAQRLGETVRSLELVFFRRDGTAVPVSCSNSPLVFQGEEIGAVLIIRDISRLKQVEEALAQSEERLRLALEASKIGIWDLSISSRALKLDANSREALGFAPEAPATVSNWLRTLHPEDRNEVKARIEKALRSDSNGHFVLDCRIWGRTDRRVRFVQIHGQALFGPECGSHRPDRLVGTIQDVTLSRRVEVALRQANQDLQEFAYAAAHDLQEPLRNIMNLQGLHRRFQHTDQQAAEELLEAGAKEARRMHDMVKDLLLFSEAGQQVQSSETLVDANAALADALNSLQVVTRGAEVSVRGDHLPFLRIQPSHLAQLFQNLIGNAVKYRHPDRKLEVQVSAKRKGRDWLISVADNGIGFDPIYAKRIFGVFKRLHSQSEFPGSGIGLAICSRIVALYGGRIWADGELDRGATFSFTLPAATD